LSGNVYGTSHPIGRFSCNRNRVADGIPPGYACVPQAGVTALRFTQGETLYTLTQPFAWVKLRVREGNTRATLPIMGFRPYSILRLCITGSDPRGETLPYE
jgi:hypothetical protein